MSTFANCAWLVRSKARFAKARTAKLLQSWLSGCWMSTKMHWRTISWINQEWDFGSLASRARHRETSRHVSFEGFKVVTIFTIDWRNPSWSNLDCTSKVFSTRFDRVPAAKICATLSSTLNKLISARTIPDWAISRLFLQIEPNWTKQQLLPFVLQCPFLQYIHHLRPDQGFVALFPHQ